MHDIRAIRDDPEAFDAAMERRGLPGVAGPIVADDAERRAALTALQEVQARRNALAKDIGQGRRLGVDTNVMEVEATTLSDRIEALERTAARLEAGVQEALAALPNVLDPDVPDGADESSNVIEKQVGEPQTFSFTPREHFAIVAGHRWMDFTAAGKLAGSRFTVLRGPLARLERALGQFMIDLHTSEKHGYEETAVPLLVNSAAVYGTNQLPKFADDLFRTTDDRWLIPTAEVPLTNLVAGQITTEWYLPMRVTALTECFRKEAGSAGRDTRGMLRQHQFRKVEMVSITRPDQSDAEHERMTTCAEAVLDALGLAYRRVLLCSGDTGFGAAKTYDLEVWLPGQGAWREISSCSNTRAFQARRMNARYRKIDNKTTGFVHTLNGSGVAVGRALIAVMETYQREDGSIDVPKVLYPYMGEITRIRSH